MSISRSFSFFLSNHVAIRFFFLGYPISAGLGGDGSSWHHDEVAAAPCKVQEPVTATTIQLFSPNNRQYCRCELLSTDCLDALTCIPQTLHETQHHIRQGFETRRAMKERSDYASSISWKGSILPVGKGIQYLSQDAWLYWMEVGSLPKVVMSGRGASIFLNETFYPVCMKNEWKAFHCFFTATSENEEPDSFWSVSPDDPFISGAPIPYDRIQDVTEYLRAAKLQREVPPSQLSSSDIIPAMDHLLQYAHISRILFNRRPHMQQVCQRVLTHVNGTERVASAVPMNPQSLTVSMHLRRADSCGHANEGYAQQASPIFSHAQPSGLRKCYDVRVYLGALQRIRHIVGFDRPIEVFLSTDNSASVLTEIEFADAHLFRTITWHVLDVSRELFHYTGFVEGDGHANHAGLGESAVADLWLLSYGQVFIGHLGSRFGKVGWTLATGRYNHFIPFFSVDGHSFCCEIDEPCGLVRPFIHSMKDCITFSHELVKDQPMHPGYWEFGSLQRIIAEAKDRAETMKEVESLAVSTYEDQYGLSEWNITKPHFRTPQNHKN
eukprot:Nitzschia sp. Nitz4//scaffold117_size69655//57691//59379//NITZ4_006028-RA/size69655-snap-gene-0.9-mRNA-1//-1//CDS//3329533663//7899//frame0